MGLLERLFGKKQDDAEVATVSTPDPADEHGYVEACVEPVFSDATEGRTFRSDPTFQRVLEPLNARRYQEAIKEASRAIERFPDFDLPYKWLGSAYRATDQLERSRDVLARGLARAKRKSILLTDLGETVWRMGDIHSAVYFWCQALHCLASNPIDYNAYLLLAYVARGSGLADVEQRLLSHVDAVKPGQVRLDPTTANRLTALVSQKRNDAMTKALQGIDARYLLAT